MKVHYFQRYHQKENVATANTLLLLSRLYSASPYQFYRLLKEKLLNEKETEYEFGISFDQQVSNGKSIPDAVIFQPGFRIVIETKRQIGFRKINWFDTWIPSKEKIFLYC